MLEDKLLTSIAQKYKKTTAQVCLRFNMQRGVVVIPKSFNLDRIKDNFQVYLHYGLFVDESKLVKNKMQEIKFWLICQNCRFSTSLCQRRRLRRSRGWTRTFALWYSPCKYIINETYIFAFFENDIHISFYWLNSWADHPEYPFHEEYWHPGHWIKIFKAGLLISNWFSFTWGYFFLAQSTHDSSFPLCKCKYIFSGALA